MVSRPPAGAAPLAQARRSITRFTAPALATRPRSAPARNRHNVEVLGSGLPPRSAAVAGSANRDRSDRKSPPASSSSSTSNNKPVAFTSRVPSLGGPSDLDNHDFPLQEGHFRVTTRSTTHPRLQNQGQNNHRVPD